MQNTLLEKVFETVKGFTVLFFVFKTMATKLHVKYLSKKMKHVINALHFVLILIMVGLMQELNYYVI